MKVERCIEIDRSAEAVWNVVGREFAAADVWMSAVPKSHVETEVDLAGVVVERRIVEYTDKPNGFFAEETVTFKDDRARQLDMTIVPKNGPSLLPLARNHVAIEVHALGPERSCVRWSSEPELRAHGYLVYPLMKSELKRASGEILEELKAFVETGVPHPRKQAKMAA